jgi:hypothetical protein
MVQDTRIESRILYDITIFRQNNNLVLRIRNRDEFDPAQNVARGFASSSNFYPK